MEKNNKRRSRHLWHARRRQKMWPCHKPRRYRLARDPTSWVTRGHWRHDILCSVFRRAVWRLGLDDFRLFTNEWFPVCLCSTKVSVAFRPLLCFAFSDVLLIRRGGIPNLVKEATVVWVSVGTTQYGLEKKQSGKKRYTKRKYFANSPPYPQSIHRRVGSVPGQVGTWQDLDDPDCPLL